MGQTVSLFANPGQVVSLVVQTLDGYGDGYVFQETVSVTNNQTLFSLSQTPSTASSVSMYVNGVKQQYGVDYTVSGVSVEYSSTPLISTDVVEFTYFISSGNDGNRSDALSAPAVMSIYFPDRSLAQGFPQAMTKLETGL